VDEHYFPAAATRFGGIARGGYLYEDKGKKYDVLFKHVPGLEDCQDCHDPHSLKVRLDVCSECHNVSQMEDLKDIRMVSSATHDYDGDGNLVEGLYFEIEGLRTMLLERIMVYANEVVGSPVVYDGGRFPYFFNDTDGDGDVDDGEASFPNRYSTFTSRLLKATFNFQYATKDPGGFAHNGKFVIQLLFDAIEDLNEGLSPGSQIDISSLTRTDRGHFDGTAEAFRHWDGDSDNAVNDSCARCHSAASGFEEFLSFGTNLPQPIANGFDCAVCHTTFDSFETRRILDVTFPSDKTISVDAATPTDDPLVQSNICMTCHQGRVSKKTIDEAIASGSALSFQNVHYLAAGATLQGTEAMVGYEYDGKTYVGKFPHVSTNPTNTNHCVFCHDPVRTNHTFLPQDNIDRCRDCHRAQDGSTLMDVKDIRLSLTDDYDGDGLFPGGATTETLDGEIDTMAAELLDAMKDYAAGTLGKPVVYDGDRYPYFFNDTDGDRTTDPSEANFGNRYTSWDGTLLKAAHNYQHSQKEPGAWAHNFRYIVQLLYDSIEDLGGDVSSFIRPS